MHNSHFLFTTQSPNTLQQKCDSFRQAGQTIGFVPTMGCLHEGHLSLMREARARCDRVIVSIFVNPLQFGKNEDFGTYPRPLENDLQKCSELGADLVFHPNVTDFYSDNFNTRIDSGPLGKLYCGHSRPGFFDGVLTVVAILLNLTRPHFAFFGEKDFQQLLLIKQLVRDFRFQTQIVGMPIFRESSGLAMSSRNEYLTAPQKKAALCLSHALKTIQSAYAQGNQSAPSLLNKVHEILSSEPRLTVDYLQIVDEDTLEALCGQISVPARMLIAAYVGETPRVRLIDNSRINFG